MTAVHGEPQATDQQPRGWTMDDTTFGARLALVRQRMQWNIKEAAIACGIPPASWASWEAGALPRNYVERCAQIAAASGADYLWLLDGPRARKTGINESYARPAKRPAHRAIVRTVSGPPIDRGPRDPSAIRPISSLPISKRRPGPVRPMAGRP